MSNVFALHASKMTLSLPTVQSARKFAQDAAARGHICVVQSWGLGRRPTKTEMDETLAQYGLCFHPIWVVAPMTQPQGASAFVNADDALAAAAKTSPYSDVDDDPVVQALEAKREQFRWALS